MKYIQNFCYLKKQLKTFSQPLLLVNENDQPLSYLSKKTCHEISYINQKESLPHRAFSVFIFNKQYELLMQRRSQYKITYPLQWTNSCCSHQHEENIEQTIKDRCTFELNVGISNLTLINKVLYKSKSCETWGEFELDWILFAKIQPEIEIVDFNLEEVDKTVWIKRHQLKEWMRLKQFEGEQFTPWFQGVVDLGLLKYWEQFENNQLESWREGSKIQWLNQY